MKTIPSNAVAIPGLPGYFATPEGTVYSVKRGGVRALTQQSGARDHLRTVRLGRVDVRVRDLTWLLFGTAPADRTPLEEWA